jgi:hypothetical protein
MAAKMKPMSGERNKLKKKKPTPLLAEMRSRPRRGWKPLIQNKAAGLVHRAGKHLFNS